MKPPKRRPAAPPQAAASVAVRVAYSPEAKAALERLAPKVREGLRKKLRAFGENPAIGKPLIGELLGYHRVTYGRVRSIAKRVEAEAVVRVADGVVIVHVLLIGLRKQGALDDPYEVAALKALREGDPDAIQLMHNLVRRVLQDPSAVNDDD